MNLDIRVASGYLYITATGRFSIEESHMLFYDILFAVAEHKIGKVFVDGRGLTGEISFMDRLEIGRFWAQAVAEFLKRNRSLPPLFAFVLKEPLISPTRLGENMAVKGGMITKIFDNLGEAFTWLEVEPMESNSGID
jgi:hypothetical protein